MKAELESKMKRTDMRMIRWVIDVKGKGSFYIVQYPVRWTAQSTSHFLPSLADLFRGEGRDDCYTYSNRYVQ